MAATTTCPWHTLPTEMKLAVVEALHVDDVKSFSRVDQRTYDICVPATFKVPHIASRVERLPNFTLEHKAEEL